MSDFTKLHRLERVAALNGASTRARAVWSLVHHALDRRGRMRLGGAEWQSVLVRRLGVDTAERQWFYAGLRELASLGIASVQGDEFVLGGHAGADEKPARKDVTSGELLPPSSGPATDLPPTSSRCIADVSQTSSGPSADLPQTYRERITDLHPVSAGHHSETAPRARVQNREEEKRGEGEESACAPTAAPPRNVPRHVEAFERSLAAPTAADGAVVALVSETRQAAGGGPFRPTGWHDREAVQKLAEWSGAPEIGPDRLRAALVAFWASKGTAARLTYLVEEDPGRFLGEVKGRRQHVARAASHEEHAAAVAAAGGQGYAVVQV